MTQDQTGLMKVSALWIYPVKSCGGITLPQVEVTEKGFMGDRQWMIVDTEGNFLTQRQYPQLARVKTQLTDTELILNFDNFSTLKIARQQKGELKTVSIWRDQTQGIDQGIEAKNWFSEVLQISCHLVRQSPEKIRPINSKYALWENQAVSFADGYPILLTNTASLKMLSEKLGEDLPMNRFRPNLVVETDEPFAEDHWQKITINQTKLIAAKPCERCIITTTDQTTGDRHPAQEPLKTLATFRHKKDQGILFGINVMPSNTGVISVGEIVEISIN